MKLVAKKDFRNNCGLKIENAKHDNHVHKGAVFEINEETADGEQLLATLKAADCIADGSNEKAVKHYQTEAAADAKRNAPAEAKK